MQVVGALIILVAFAGAQFGKLDQHSRAYLALNLLGSVVLGVLAYLDEQWGFLLLEGVWALVSFWGLAQLARGRDPARAH